MNDNHDISIINERNLAEKIYLIRGVKVMLDFELAEIYGYETRAFNQQVKNNIRKFEGEDFRFRLSDEEYENLKSKKLISSLSWGGKRYNPVAFTESGLYMLMTVLKGELAIKQSRALIRTFRAMKDYIIENRGLLGEREYLQLSMQTTNNVKDIFELRGSLNKVEDKLANIMDKLGELVVKSEISEHMLDFGKPQIRRGYLVLNGQPVKASLAYKEIYSEAEKTIYVVDNYIGLKTLVLLKDVPENVEIIIFSDNLGKKLHSIEYNDFQKEYPDINIELKKSGGIFHDRYIIIDYKTENEKVYHCGASSKDAGDRVTTITEVPEKEIYNNLIENLLKNEKLILLQT